MVLMYGLCMFLALFGGFRDQSVYRFGKVFMVYETEHDGVSNHFIFWYPSLMVCFGLKRVCYFLLLRLKKVSSKSFFTFDVLLCYGGHFEGRKRVAQRRSAEILPKRSF